MAKVSIIIPVYNVEKYLKECLDSVRNQTLKEIEVICIDDGSTDSSGKILDLYAEKDNRFRVIHKQNAGYGAAMNAGLRMATAPYVGIVESDDMVIPYMYENLLFLMEKNQVDVIKADFYEFYDSGEEGYIEQYISLATNKKLEDLYGIKFNIREHEEAFLLNKHTWSGLYNREFLVRENIMHNETAGASYQDTGFWFQTMVKAKDIYVEKQAFYRYRIDNSQSSMYSKDKIFALCEEYAFINDMLSQMGDKGKIFYKWSNYIKITDCINSINRVADENKEALAQRVKEEFLLAVRLGEVNPDIYNDYWKAKIFDIVINPKYYVEKEKFRRRKIEKAVYGYDTIIIYGAGQIGCKVQQILKEGRINTKIKCFAVTELGQDSSIFGIPIRKIDDLQGYKEKALIIMSAGKKYTDEMEEALKKFKFKHYIKYSDII